METLKRTAELSPEHISAYSLIVEEGTPFYEACGSEAGKRKLLPDEETERGDVPPDKGIFKGMRL